MESSEQDAQARAGLEASEDREMGENSPASIPPVSKTAHINFDLLSKYFHLPMKEVALELGVCTTMLKRLCRNHGIPRWPFRQIKSINRMIKSMEKTKEAKSADSQRILKALEQKRRLLLTQPQPSATPSAPENPRVKKITQYTFVPNQNSQAPMEIVSEVHNVPSPEEEVVVPQPPTMDFASPFFFTASVPPAFSFKARTYDAAPSAFRPLGQQQSFSSPSGKPVAAAMQPSTAIRGFLAEIQQFILRCDDLYQTGKKEGSLLQQSQQQLLAQQQQEQVIHRTFVNLQNLQEELSSRLHQPGTVTFDASEQSMVAQRLHHLRTQLQGSLVSAGNYSHHQQQQPKHQDMYMARPQAAEQHMQRQLEHQRQLEQQQLLQRQREEEMQRHEQLLQHRQLSHGQLMPIRRTQSDLTDIMDEEPDPPVQRPTSARSSWSKETLRRSMRDEIRQQQQLYIEQLHSESNSSSSSGSPPARPLSRSPPSAPLPMPMTTSSSVRTFSHPHTPHRPASTTTLGSSAGSLPRASVHVSRELSPDSLLAAKRANTHGMLHSPPERSVPDVMELASSKFLHSRVSPSSFDCSSSYSSSSTSSRDFSRMETSFPYAHRGVEASRSLSSLSNFGGPSSPLGRHDQYHSVKLPALHLPDEYKTALRPKIATLEPIYRSKSPGP